MQVLGSEWPCAVGEKQLELSSVNGFGLEPFLDEVVVSGFSCWDEANELSDLEGKEGAGLGSDSTLDASALETKGSALKGH